MGIFPPVLILAGGLGTRLGSITTNLPKSMVNVGGQPFIAHQLNLLRSQEVDKVILCVGHQEKPLRNFVGDGTRFGITVNYSSDGDHLLGTGGAVLKASKLVESPFAVLYGDSYLDLPFAPFADAFKRAGKLALMTVYRNNTAKDIGGPASNLLVRDGQVMGYDKENPSADMEYIDYGLSIFAADAFAGFPQSQPFDLAPVIKQLIARGELACHEVHERFHEVGSAEGLKDLERYLQDRQLKTGDARDHS